jgi:hypothetical protein
MKFYAEPLDLVGLKNNYAGKERVQGLLYHAKNYICPA